MSEPEATFPYDMGPDCHPSGTPFLDLIARHRDGAAGWNIYDGSAFREFIPNRPRIDRSEYRRRQRARVKRKRRR